MSCQICYDDIMLDARVSYQISSMVQPAFKICGSCVKDMLEAQTQHFRRWFDDMTCLQNCSKHLKALVEGRIGVPTRLHDLTIFPEVGETIVTNTICPVFGRKNEVARLWVGEAEILTSLEGAPKTSEEIRNVLKNVVTKLRDALADFDDDQVKEQLTALECRLM